MPYPGEHACRLQDPKQYDEFRRNNDKFGDGCHAIFGIKTKPKRVSELQAIRFDKKKYTVAEAKKWLKDHNHACIQFEPAKKVLAISGIIGWEVDAQGVRTFLDEAAGEDIEVQISSPGGYVYPGLEIYNLLRNHDGKITTRLMGLAASMASYIAMVGDYVIAEDNAVFMIHNASGLAIGDHNIMRKAADVMEGLSNLIAQKYMSKTGKSLDELKALMDVDTFLFGDEIEKAGFVDEIAKTEKKKDRAAAIALATISVADCVAKMKAFEQEKEDLERAAAFLKIDTKITNQGGEEENQGAWKFCVCDKCNYWEEHGAGKPCGKCPKCKTQMHGANKKPTKGGKGMTNLVEILAIEDVKKREEELDTFFGEPLDADREKKVKEALLAIKKETAVVDNDLVQVVEGLQGEIRALQDEVVESKKKASEETEKRRMLEIGADLQDKKVVGDIEKMTKTIFALEKVSPELAKDMLEQFQSMSVKLKAAGLFTEIGSVTEGDAEDSYEKMKAKVDVILETDSNITPAKAWKNVIRDNPELYKEYLKKR